MDEKSDAKMTVSQLKEEIVKFNEVRDWKKYHTPKNLAISISIEAAELLEHFQWLDNIEMAKSLQNPKQLNKIRAEIADVIIYSLNLANTLNIDVSGAILDKIKENEAKYPVEKIKGNYRKYSEI